MHGREELLRFLEEEFPRRLWEPVAATFRPLDDERIVVEGRIRWMDDDGVIRDDPRVWALEFREGLLVRSVPAESVAEARALLQGEAG
ncbi:MAG TPA: hypothetical protein VNJ53_08840 [Gaiellaceae bacterium]|nr:hypothetical protein [Gaiellaceae bacterium]